MRTRSRVVSGLVACAACALGAVAEPAVSGLWGDRSGVYPQSDPPVRWDSDTGLNILWHTPTPTFCYGAPVVLGDRVVYLNDIDPEHPFPLLIGLDLATGKECWRVEVNPLAASIDDPAKRSEVEALYRATLRWRGEFSALRADWQQAADKGALSGRMAALGLKPDGDMGRKGYPGKEDAATPSLLGAPWTEPWKALNRAGLTLDTWRSGGGGWFFGEGFATPVSDGERVYIQLAWGVWAAYDRDGRQLWMRHLPSQAGGDYCQCGRSPLLWHGRLIADQGDWVRAFDAGTGREVWAWSRGASGVKQHEMMSPMVMTVGGVDVLYVNSYPPTAVRLEDGVPLKIEGITDPGLIARVNTDRPDVVYLAGGGEHGGWNKNNPVFRSPAAVQLAFPSSGSATGLTATVLWHGLGDKSYGSQLSWNIHHDGKLYFRDVILDALTGKLLTGRPNARNDMGQAVPGSTFTLAITGTALGQGQARIYGQGYAEHGSEERKDDLGAVVNCEVHDLLGRRLAVNRLRGLAGQSAMRIRNGIPNWYSYANNFTIAGNRILSRSCNEVICIGEIRRAFSDSERAAIAPGLGADPSLEAVLAHLRSPDRPVRVAAAQAIGRMGAKASGAAPALWAQMQDPDEGLAEAGFLALCTLGPNGGAVASNLVAAARGGEGVAALRSRRALAAMGAGAEAALVGGLGDETGYALAMQTAALMDDDDAATRILAHGLLGGKAPRFMPWLPPYERGQELTLRDIVPEALLVRAWRSKAGADLLLAALPADAAADRQTFLSYVRLIAPADPAALVPRLADLRRLLRSVEEGGRFTWALDALAAMGPLAREALPDLVAWRAEPGLDGRIAAKLDAAIARMGG